MTKPHPNTLSKLPLSTITSTLPTGLHGNPRFDQPGPPPSTAATMPPYKSRPTTPHSHLPPAPSPPKPKPTRPPHPTPQTHQDMAYIYGPASAPDLQVCALMTDQIKGTLPSPLPPVHHRANSPPIQPTPASSSAATTATTSPSGTATTAASARCSSGTTRSRAAQTGPPAPSSRSCGRRTRCCGWRSRRRGGRWCRACWRGRRAW